MSPASSRPESRTLAFWSVLFILAFFVLFSYSGLYAYFTFDDGTAVVADSQHFVTPWWRNVLHVLTVFTAAKRPMATMFWRPMYAIFGFHPVPYRIVIQLMMLLNIGLVYVMSKRLEMARSAALLVTLVFCYNGSMCDLYFDSCTVTDVLCFIFFILGFAAYALGRQGGNLLSPRRVAGVGVCYLLALDSKELAVALPGVLTVYEALFHHRDFRDRQKALRIGGFLAAMFAVGAIYLKVKVADMSQTSAYKPHVTIAFILDNFAVYLRELLYLPEKSVTPLGACLIIGGLIAVGALLRSRQTVLGALFFVIALIPVAVIPPRGGYCAYVPYFGLALAAGAILASVRTHLVRLLHLSTQETRTEVVWFLLIGALLGWDHMVHWNPSSVYFEWSNPQVVGMYEYFQRNIPEFPPNSRVLIAEDPWPGDWGQMFLLELMYHDKTLWVDRPKNMDRPPDLASYDLVVKYRSGNVDLSPTLLFGKYPMAWRIRGKTTEPGMFSYSSPAAHGAVSHVDFAPQAVRGSQNTTVTIPGLSNVAINVLYRIVSEKKSTRHIVANWCTLDAQGSCTIAAPSVDRLGAMVVDWIQPANQRWIFTGGVLAIVE